MSTNYHNNNFESILRSRKLYTFENEWRREKGMKLFKRVSLVALSTVTALGTALAY